MRVAVIGGGASGMMAALRARAFGHDVVLFEKQARVGRKLLATGNGRCNLTNAHADVSHYHGSDKEFISSVLNHYNVEDTLSYFRSLGLLTLEESSGRIYPYSNMAGSLLDVLRFAMDRTGVEVRTGCAVKSITHKGDFEVTAEDGKATFNSVILALGGAAGGKVGGGMDGYTLAKSLGHHRTQLYPSLVQVKTDPTYPRALKGVKAEALVSVMAGKDVLAQRKGEVLFTEYGLSGPAIFDVSRAIATTSERSKILLDLLPDFTFDETLSHIRKCGENFMDKECSALLSGSLQSRLGQMIMKSCGFTSQGVSSLEEKDYYNIVSAIKNFPLDVQGVCSFDQAQVTAGGLDTHEFKKESLESTIVPGLYACGELLDVDGDCGGFNLQWAWSSGYLAGELR